MNKIQGSYLGNLMSALDNTEGTVFDDDRIIDIYVFQELLVDFLIKKRSERAQFFMIGNGGSAAIAIHMTADYLKNGGMRTVSFFDPATLTCLGNDYGYEHVFDKQIEQHGEAGDVVVAISSSGKSQNIINSIQIAREMNLETITFTGFNPNNPVRQLGRMNVYVPSYCYGIVESVHNLLLQQMVDEIMERDGRRCR